MVDRLKIRLFIKMFGKEFRLDETNFTSNLSAFKDGPVRVIRRVRSAVRLNKILKTPSAASETIYYQNAVAIPFRIKNPINLKPIKKLFALRYIKVRAGIDMQNLHERDRDRRRDKTLLFRRRNIVESFLYVKKKWGTIYGVLGMRYGRKGCEWLQKEGSRCDQLLN
jgi:hypothetical protein